MDSMFACPTLLRHKPRIFFKSEEALDNLLSSRLNLTFPHIFAKEIIMLFVML